MLAYKMRIGLNRLARLLALAALAMLAAGCSSTLVVLVPDPGGKVGEVSVTTAKETTVLTVAGESISTSRVTSSFGEAEVLTKENIVRVFGPALENEPLPPERHILYFQFDTTRLRAQSRKKLPHIYQAIGNRQVCDVSVIGHTDRMGTVAYNYRLSMRRAQRMQRELIKLGLDKACLTVRYYGENDPLVPTVDGVAKRVNRRVEIEIR